MCFQHASVSIQQEKEAAQPSDNMTLDAEIQNTFPREIEVKWELPDHRKVWWKANVTALQLQSGFKDGHRFKDLIQQASAVLQYEAGHGFAASFYHVRFKTTDLLEHTGNECGNSLSNWRVSHPHQSDGLRVSSGIVKKTKSRKKDGGPSKLYKELETLRRVVARNSEKLGLMESTLEYYRAKDLSAQKEPTERHAASTLAFLVHRLALELSKSPAAKLTKHSMEGDDGLFKSTEKSITRSFVRVAADCELREFGMISNLLSCKAGDFKSKPLFFPCYERTQLPCVGEKFFSIALGSFSDLCECLGILSISDRMRMLVNYGKRRGEGIMRILGAYRLVSDDNEESSELFLGRSIGERSCPIRQSNPNTAICQILTRETSSWNTEDRSYQCPLRIIDAQMSAEIKRHCENGKYIVGNHFELRWKRAQDLLEDMVSCYRSFRSGCRETRSDSSMHHSFWQYAVRRIHITIDRISIKKCSWVK